MKSVIDIAAARRRQPIGCRVEQIADEKMNKYSAENIIRTASEQKNIDNNNTHLRATENKRAAKSGRASDIASLLFVYPDNAHTHTHTTDQLSVATPINIFGSLTN